MVGSCLQLLTCFLDLKFSIEPTSALDAATSEQVENSLMSMVESSHANLKALVWITHSQDQGRRVGTRFLRVTAGGIHEDRPAVV